MNKSKEIALGGLMTALAVVIMSVGTMLPFMTYVSPVLCMMIGAFILKIINKTGFISWYFAVTVLSLLLCPDKEAAAVFTAFGIYPLFRVKLNKLPLKWLFKLIYFNVITIFLYWSLMNIIGMQELVRAFSDIGTAMTIGMLIAGNFIFVILDFTLQRLDRSDKYKFAME